VVAAKATVVAAAMIPMTTTITASVV